MKKLILISLLVIAACNCRKEDFEGKVVEHSSYTTVKPQETHYYVVIERSDGVRKTFYIDIDFWNNTSVGQHLIFKK